MRCLAFTSKFSLSYGFRSPEIPHYYWIFLSAFSFLIDVVLVKLTSCTNFADHIVKYPTIYRAIVRIQEEGMTEGMTSTTMKS